MLKLNRISKEDIVVDQWINDCRIQIKGRAGTSAFTYVRIRNPKFKGKSDYLEEGITVSQETDSEVVVNLYRYTDPFSGTGDNYFWIKSGFYANVLMKKYLERK